MKLLYNYQPISNSIPMTNAIVDNIAPTAEMQQLRYETDFNTTGNIPVKT